LGAARAVAAVAARHARLTGAETLAGALAGTACDRTAAACVARQTGDAALAQLTAHHLEAGARTNRRAGDAAGVVLIARDLKPAAVLAAARHLTRQPGRALDGRVAVLRLVAQDRAHA